jgi:hypothetical protein
MLSKVRNAIASELQALGVNDVADLRETILIRDGLFCGRKFQCQGYSVVWFMEENEIKFFGPTGQLLLATTPDQCVQPAVQPIQIRRAA